MFTQVAAFHCSWKYHVLISFWKQVNKGSCVAFSLVSALTWALDEAICQILEAIRSAKITSNQ